MAVKWVGDLPPTYAPTKWREVWNKNRSQKEASFLWSVYQKAIAVNYWRAQVIPRNPLIPRDPLIPRIDARCTCCLAGTAKTILHRFYHCSKTINAWIYGLTILYLSRNAHCFNNNNWIVTKIQYLLWEATLNLGRMAWAKAQHLCQQRPRQASK
jgi:hypothetical protein